MPPRRRRRRRLNKRLLWWIAGGAALVLLLPFVVAGILIATIDPNSYKAQIESETQQALGRELRIRGPISVSASLSPTLVAQDVVLANVPGGSRPDMMRIEELDLQLSPRALLTGRFVVARAIILRPDILLEVDANGHGNWQFSRPPTPAPAAGATASAAISSHASNRVIVQTLNLREGRLTWHDGRTELSTVFDLRRISANEASPDAPVILSADIGLGRQRVQLSGQLGPMDRLFDTAAETPWGPVFIKAESAGANLTVAGTFTHPLTGGGYALRVDGAIPDLGALSWMSPVRLPPVHNLIVSGRVQDTGTPIPDISDVTIQTGLTNLDSFSPGFTLETARIDMPRLTEPVVVDIEGTFAASPFKLAGTIGAPALLLPGAKPDGVFAINLSAEAAGGGFAARGAILTPTKLSGMDIAIGARVPDLSLLTPLAGRPLPALKSIAFSGHLVDTDGSYANGVTLRGIALTLQQGDVSGEMTVKLGTRPRFTATLASAKFDVDAFLAALRTQVPNEADRLPAGDTSPADAIVPPPLPRRSVTVIPDTKLPLQLLDRADADIRADVTELRAGNVTYRGLSGHAVLEAGKLLLDPFGAEAPGGHMDIRLAIDSRAPAPPVSLLMHAPGLALNPLMAAFGARDQATGTVDIEADLHASGTSPHEMAATLDGKLGIGLADVDVDNALLGSLVNNLLRTAKLGVETGDTGRTRLHCVVMRSDATHGLATIGTGLLDTGRLLLNATGQVNLNDETLALHVRPMLRTGGPGIVVPMRADGTFRDPKLSLEPSVISPGNVSTVLGSAAASVAAGLLPGARTVAPATAGGALGERGGDACGPALSMVRAMATAKN